MIEELTEFTGNKASSIARAIEDRYEEAIDAWEKEMEEKEMEENMRRLATWFLMEWSWDTLNRKTRARRLK